MSTPVRCHARRVAVLGLAALVGLAGPGCVAPPNRDPEWTRRVHHPADERYAYAIARLDASLAAREKWVAPSLVGWLAALVGFAGILSTSRDDRGTYQAFVATAACGLTIGLPCSLGHEWNQNAANGWGIHAGLLGSVWPGGGVAGRPWTVPLPPPPNADSGAPVPPGAG